MTRKVKEGLATVEVKLLDHVLIAGDQAISFNSLQLL
jgi:DNA repair protein RadC